MIVTTCRLEGCDKKRDGRSSLCAMHRARFKKYGDFTTTKKAANGDGYISLGYAGHQIYGVRKFDHVRIAEKALGKPLPKGAVVHHVNEDRLDNRNENLVICPDRAYHNMLHARMRAQKNGEI